MAGGNDNKMWQQHINVDSGVHSESASGIMTPITSGDDQLIFDMDQGFTQDQVDGKFFIY